MFFEFLLFFLILNKLFFNRGDSQKCFKFFGDISEIRIQPIVGRLQIWEVWFCGSIGWLSLIWDFLDSFLRISDFLLLNIARFLHLFLKLGDFLIYPLRAQHFQFNLLLFLITLRSLLILRDLSRLLAHSFLHPLNILVIIITGNLSLICNFLNFFKYFSVFLL